MMLFLLFFFVRFDARADGGQQGIHLRVVDDVEHDRRLLAFELERHAVVFRIGRTGLGAVVFDALYIAVAGVGLWCFTLNR